MANNRRHHPALMHQFFLKDDGCPIRRFPTFYLLFAYLLQDQHCPPTLSTLSSRYGRYCWIPGQGPDLLHHRHCFKRILDISASFKALCFGNDSRPPLLFSPDLLPW